MIERSANVGRFFVFCCQASLYEASLMKGVQKRPVPASLDNFSELTEHKENKKS